MGMLRAVTIAFLATFGFAPAAAPARADGTPDRYPTYDATPGFYDFNWTGFFVGAHLGGAHTELQATETIFDALFGPVVQTYAQDGASVIGGVHAGWQKQWEKLVAGIEATYSTLPFDQTTVSPILPGVVTRTGEVHDIFTLTGRLGYADGRWLAYAKAGWASAQIDIALRDTVTGNVASSGGRENGWTAGVGIEYALSLNLSLGVEYNYLHFDADVAPLPIPDTAFSDAEIDIQTLVVRLNYRFGGPGCGPGPQHCR
jgi:outer membrane immunogenic protein